MKVRARVYSMTDILLIHPSGAHGIVGDHPVYGDLADELTAQEQPLWCRLIASYLLDRGHSVEIIDMEVTKITPVTLAEIVICMRPKLRLVVIVAAGHQPSASTQSMPAARAVAQAIKNVSNVRIALLGNHASALPERTLREEPVDFVIDGEGPVTLDLLLKNEEPYTEIPGLVYWAFSPLSGDIAHNKPAPLLDLNDLHGRAWHLLPPPLAYRCHNWQTLGQPAEARRPYAAIYTSLSCPFDCHFCMIQTMFHSHKYRMRDPKAVVDEIKMLRDTYGVNTFKIIDELFVLNRYHYLSICSELAKLPYAGDLNIWAYARTDTVHPDDLPLMRRAGIRWLALGIESGSKSVRATAGKALRGDKAQDPNYAIVKTVRAIQDADINVIGNYIFGLPDDDMASMKETLDLALELNTEWANFYVCHCYPGSELYEQALKEGWKLPSTWAGYSQHNKWTRPIDTKYISAKEVLAFRDEAFQTYFSSHHYLSMIKAKFGELALQQIQAMLLYKLERALLTGEIT